MTQVWDRLFIGGIDDACEIAELNPFGINTVITLYQQPVRITAGWGQLFELSGRGSPNDSSRSTRCDPGCPLGEHPVGPVAGGRWEWGKECRRYRCRLDTRRRL